MPVPTRSLCVAVPLAVLTAALGGCGASDGIRSYDVPREATHLTHTPPAGQGQEFRVLGAMFPADKPAWFFKFSGTAEQVGRYEPEFDAMLRSVRLNADPRHLPEYTPPAGWTRVGPRTVKRNGVSIKIDETLRLGPADAPLAEVTVTYSPGGSAMINFERWAKQVGIANPTDVDFVQGTREFDAAGGKGLRADVKGPKNPASGPMGGK